MTRALRALPLDYDPRSLIVRKTKVAHAGGAATSASCEGIFIPCRGREGYVEELLLALPDPEIPVFLLPTQKAHIVTNRSGPVKVLDIADPEYLSVVERMRCPSNKMCISSLREWDLPAKRNYALWYARKHHLGSILLLDDDIRSLRTDSLIAGAKALSQQFDIAGFLVDYFPDTSAIGHVQIALGERIPTFLSGSCLFVRVQDSLGYFPPIYNEDWLFMIPYISRGRACSLGRMRQKPYDPFRHPSVARFQEPGEIVTDCLFALLACRRYEERFERMIWHDFIARRRAWLTELSTRSLDTRQRATVEEALSKCLELTDEDCIQFIRDWEFDRELWASTLEELH